MCDETGTRDLAQHRVVMSKAQFQTALRISHDTPAYDRIECSRNRPTHGAQGSGSTTNIPSCVRIHESAAISNITSCRSPSSLKEMNQLLLERQAAEPTLSVPVFSDQATAKYKPGFVRGSITRSNNSLF